MIRSLNFLLALLLAAFVTFSLFYLMQFLITATGETPRPGERRLIGDISIPEIDIEVRTEVPKPLEPEQPEELPPLPEYSVDVNQPAGPSFAIGEVVPADDFDVGNPVISPSDSDYLPIVTVPADYPQRALLREIEGWCQVSFTVDETGAVLDAMVVDAEPPGYFESASLRAVSRFKFNPQVRGGEPVRTSGVQYVFIYELEEE